MADAPSYRRSRQHRTPGTAPRWRKLLGAVAVVAGATTVPALAAWAAPTHPAASDTPTTGTAVDGAPATGTVVTTATTPYGLALVVGSGTYAGYSLYFITSDHGTSFGCTTKAVSTPVGKLHCTGPEGDTKAEWPALTTTGAPVAGPGLTSSLIGTVTRSFGTQVTYAGHPLYLFDNGPGRVTGEGWDEASLPPWHGVWDLLAPSGLALPWAGTLTTTAVDGQVVLSTQMISGGAWVDYPVYSYSKDTATQTACRSNACLRAWPPVLTSGTPGVAGGLSAADVGTVASPWGTQVTYQGKPLYLYSDEGVIPGPIGFFLPDGSGNGLTFDGGTFNLITEAGSST